MDEFQPIKHTTVVRSNEKNWVWLPHSFKTFLIELEHISTKLLSLDRLILFRGQCDSSWLIDSTIARSLKQKWFKVPMGEKFNFAAQNSFELHMRLSSAVLLKFRYITVPSPGLSDLGEIHLDLDLLFDAMKRMQQYPHLEPD